MTLIDMPEERFRAILVSLWTRLYSERTEFQFALSDMGVDRTINIPVYQRGAKLTSTARVVRVFTDQGVTGEYLGGSATEYSALPMFVRAVLGRSALAREAIYNDAKQALRQHARMGMSQVDMALWDLAGKWFDVPVYQLLGEQRRSFPAYASTYCGDREPDGLGGRILDQADVVLGQPLTDVVGGRLDLEDPVVQAPRPNAPEPHRERALAQLLLSAFDDVGPGPLRRLLERCDRHSYPHGLSTVVETPGEGMTPRAQTNATSREARGL